MMSGFALSLLNSSGASINHGNIFYEAIKIKVECRGLKRLNPHA